MPTVLFPPFRPGRTPPPVLFLSSRSTDPGPTVLFPPFLPARTPQTVLFPSDLSGNVRRTVTFTSHFQHKPPYFRPKALNTPKTAAHLAISCENRRESRNRGLAKEAKEAKEGSHSVLALRLLRSLRETSPLPGFLWAKWFPTSIKIKFNSRKPCHQDACPTPCPPSFAP